MLATFALSPAAAKRVIARGLIKTPEFTRAFRLGKIIISVGTTNGYIAEELGLLTAEEKPFFAAGITSAGVPCATAAETRLKPFCLNQGQPVDTPWEEFLNTFGRDDVFIKGANALDPTGATAVLMGSLQGGTVGAAYGMLQSRGSQVFIPVGHEKMIPSCQAASAIMGISRMDDSIGMRCGLAVIPFGRAYTEIDALRTLFGVEAIVVAAGGIAGSEGSVMLSVQGEEAAVNAALDLARNLLKEKALKINRGSCKNCIQETRCRIHNK